MTIGLPFFIGGVTKIGGLVPDLVILLLPGGVLLIKGVDITRFYSSASLRPATSRGGWHEPRGGTRRLDSHGLNSRLLNRIVFVLFKYTSI